MLIFTNKLQTYLRTTLKIFGTSGSILVVSTLFKNLRIIAVIELALVRETFSKISQNYKSFEWTPMSKFLSHTGLVLTLPHFNGKVVNFPSCDIRSGSVEFFKLCKSHTLLELLFQKKKYAVVCNAIKNLKNIAFPPRAASKLFFFYFSDRQQITKAEPNLSNRFLTSIESN